MNQESFNYIIKEFKDILEKMKVEYNISDQKIAFFCMYYGISHTEKNTLQSIAEIYDLSKERVRQSIIDVKNYLKRFIENSIDCGFFIERLKKINEYILSILPMIKTEILYKLFDSDQENNWVFHQKDIFNIDSGFLIVKVNNVDFVIMNTFQSKKLPPYKVRKIEDKSITVKNNEIINLNSIGFEKKELLAKNGFLEKATIIPLIKTVVKKEIIKSSTFNIYDFVEKKWSIIEGKIIGFDKFSEENKIKIIKDYIKTDKNILESYDGWFYSFNIGRNIIIKNTKKVVFATKKSKNVNDIRKLLILKTNIEYIPPEHVLMDIYKNSFDFEIVDEKIILKENLENDFDILSDKEKELKIKIENNGGSYKISSYDKLWDTSYNSIIFKKDKHNKVILV